jgi:hypothetical protein
MKAGPRMFEDEAAASAVATLFVDG